MKLYAWLKRRLPVQVAPVAQGLRTRLYLESLDTREVPAVVTWDGARNGGLSIDNLGYIGDNWVGGEVPSAGDDILIPATSR